MSTLRDVYAKKALSQIPRLLGNLDRNPFSPTYGCFHRDYWLDKTSDFPDAVRQFATHALALVYKYDFPGNIYKGRPKIRDWAIAGIDYWIRIQHRDGSFDEFYPYERGWVGPSAFTTFAISEAYQLLKDEMPTDVKERALAAIRRAAYFIAAGESEEDHLANHHAMACLAVWKAYKLLGDAELKVGFARLWQGFLAYNRHEGWSREYDGVDPGYLSATVSFLAKIYQENPGPEILKVLEQSVEFCSYFVYPNGFYAGSIGSRNTLHFYPHGFEILADKIPMAAAVAERMLQGLADGALVPPDIISDRYVVYRVPEFLQAYLDCTSRPEMLPPLPYQRESFRSYFPEAGIYVEVKNDHYIVVNLAKGGVIKVFDWRKGRLLLNDCGLIGRLSDGRVVSSQWLDPDYKCRVSNEGWEVSGHLHAVPSNKLFTPLKNILFRSALVVLGWSPALSHWLKGQIRKTLILGQRPVPVRFQRRMRFESRRLILTDDIYIEGNIRFDALSVGDEFFVRYVPQSRYFQAQELAISGYRLDEADLARLSSERHITLAQQLPLDSKKEGPTMQILTDSTMFPTGVYDVDYYHGRQKKRQLIYRLRRRTDEVERALRRYNDGSLQTILDVGTADGLMLAHLRERLGSLTFLGVDLSINLLLATPIDGVGKLQADALSLPFSANTIDAVIATAVIEHVSNSFKMVGECARVLRSGGLLVLTTPDPTMDRIATAIGLLKDGGHQETFSLKKLCSLCEENGFGILEARKFMFSPIGFPAEKTIERFLGPLGLGLIMANQLVVARRR